MTFDLELGRSFLHLMSFEVELKVLAEITSIVPLCCCFGKINKQFR